MNKLTFSINIQATPKKVWDAMWNNSTYREWATYFNAGTYYKTSDSSLAEGSRIDFLSADGKSGVYSRIFKHIPFSEIQFKCLGMIQDGKDVPLEENVPEMMEIYQIQPIRDGVCLTASIDNDEEYTDFFNEVYPQALAKIKTLAQS